MNHGSDETQAQSHFIPGGKHNCLSHTNLILINFTEKSKFTVVNKVSQRTI